MTAMTVMEGGETDALTLLLSSSPSFSAFDTVRDDVGNDDDNSHRTNKDDKYNECNEFTNNILKLVQSLS